MSARRLLAAICLVVVACTAPGEKEFINLTFQASADTSGYATWDFDIASIRDPGDARLHDTFIRARMLEEIEIELSDLGFTRSSGGAVDFFVFYEIFVVGDEGNSDLADRVRGKIFVRDATTGRLVWRGERKARLHPEKTQAERAERIHEFVSELLQYTSKLRARLRLPDPKRSSRGAGE